MKTVWQLLQKTKKKQILNKLFEKSLHIKKLDEQLKNDYSLNEYAKRKKAIKEIIYKELIEYFHMINYLDIPSRELKNIFYERMLKIRNNSNVNELVLLNLI